MILPIGREHAHFRRWPVVGIALVVLNLLAFLGTKDGVEAADARIGERFMEVVSFAAGRDYLVLPPELRRAAPRDGPASPELSALMKALGARGPAPPDAFTIQRDQEHLDALVDAMRAERATHPYVRYGLIPAEPRAGAVLTSMFMHAGWLHLLGNLWIFVVLGLFLEDAYGHAAFAGLYLVTGVIAGLSFVALYPTSDTPLVGASGAISGVLGAYLLRFARTRIRMAWWFFLRGGTFLAPAWILLPLWLVEQLFGLVYLDFSGVAYVAHVGGFAAGFVLAWGISRLGWERGVDEALDSDVAPPVRRLFLAAMDAEGRGDLRAATRALERAVREDPASLDLPRHAWRLYRSVGDGDRGRPHALRLVRAALEAGDPEEALRTWRELEATRATGPAAMRWRLAEALQDGNPAAARPLLEALSRDEEAGPFRDKAVAALAAAAAAEGRPEDPAWAWREAPAAAPLAPAGEQVVAPAPDAAAAPSYSLDFDLSAVLARSAEAAAPLEVPPRPALPRSPTDGLTPAATFEPVAPAGDAGALEPELDAWEPFDYEEMHDSRAGRGPEVHAPRAGGGPDEVHDSRAGRGPAGGRLDGGAPGDPGLPDDLGLAAGAGRSAALGGPEAAAPGDDEEDLQATREMSFTPEISPGPGPATAAKAVVKRPPLRAVEPTLLVFSGGVELEIRRVQSVSAAVVMTPAGPVTLVDLVLNWRRRAPGDALRVVRVDSRSVPDLPRVLGHPELSVDGAFAHLARLVAVGAACRVWPDLARLAAGDLPSFPDEGRYRAAALVRDPPPDLLEAP